MYRPVTYLTPFDEGLVCAELTTRCHACMCTHVYGAPQDRETHYSYSYVCVRRQREWERGGKQGKRPWFRWLWFTPSNGRL